MQLPIALFLSQEHTLSFTDNMVALLGSALADPEEPFSTEIEEVAGTATECLKNVLKSASGNEENGNSSESKVSSLLDQ